MDSKKQKNIFNAFLIFFIILTIAAISFSIYFFTSSSKQFNARTHNIDKSIRNYHIIITGSYENKLFLQQVYEGANRYSDYYNSVVELYVPGSQAEDMPLQSLLDYAGYVNADGVIFFNDTTDNHIELPRRPTNDTIPVVTTGQYNPNLQQVSYIGTSYWELGKKISNAAISYLHGNGRILVINTQNSNNNNYSNLLNSLQDGLRFYKGIKYSIIEEKQLNEENLKNNNLIICLTEEDTIQIAQKLQEYYQINTKRLGLLGFGTNETCQLYLDKGIVSELIAVDPVKIGETAIKELFEYRNKGYANSYIAADVKILGGENAFNHLH